MQRIDLNGKWELIERPLETGVEAAEQVIGADADLSVTVPGDVNDALVQAGRMPDPLTALNSRELAEFVPQRSWWYRKRFPSPPPSDYAAAELSLDGLDVHADIWLNGEHIGHHASSFLPFERDVKDLLRVGEDNILLVRLTTGAERVCHKTEFPLLGAVPTEGPRGYADRGFQQRIYLRKPAYTWGWDWSPHLPTCGITGFCAIDFKPINSIRDVQLRARLAGEDASVAVTLELERHTLTSTAWGVATVALTDEDGRTHETTIPDVLLRSGRTLVNLELDIPSARLWWPNGSGEQHRYTVRATLEVAGEQFVFDPFRWGLRTVDIEVKPGLFRARINGEPVFMKGGNWIPCDHLYGRTTPERLEDLVGQAAAANFNCLRIWGGGRYELEAFYEACDREGILVWHDFMSACAPLPGDDPHFAHLFCREAEYQVQRLHNRACILLWCGNNEVGGCYEWFDGFKEMRDPAWHLYFEMLPHIVNALAPHTPYWPTSPYGGETVGDLTVGDDHHWIVMRPDKELWSCPEYWDSGETSIFNSEYGYGGPCGRKSTEQYLGTHEPDLFSEVGRQHTNTFYDIPRVNFSIEEHYCDPADLPLEDYILYGGLCQGLNLGYSLESMRANDHTWGGIFWMYNDAWGENGWTIIDHYLRRKVSFYNVKRCLAPRRLVLRRGGQAFGGTDDQVLLIAVNDTANAMKATVDFGYSSYDGTENGMDHVVVDVPPRSKEVIASSTVPTADMLARGTIMARATAPLCSTSWRHCRFRETDMPATHVEITSAERCGDGLTVTLRAEGYAHAVHLVLDDDLRPNDQYFDMLPDETRIVFIPDPDGTAADRPQVSWVNRG